MKWQVVKLFEKNTPPVFSELENSYSVERIDMSKRPYVFFDTDLYAEQRARKLCAQLNAKD